ncbi:MAG: acryloyl-CoA reductase [Luteitalea sp.]|nr:acryloyl-CoA reductase [Luteitalea sp.]
MPDSFPAFVAEERDGRVAGRIDRLTLDQLPPGDVTIEVEYSSLNFKDALAATGRNRIAASYPHVPGIDAAGTVVESSDPGVRPGDPVIVTAYEFGAGRFGGYACYARVPHEWVVRRPSSLSAFDAMAIGTAGYTAAMALLAIQHNGTRPSDGPIIVTGATGGVGCLAIDLFAAAGYEVAASTGKPTLHDWLRRLGASELLSRDEAAIPAGAEVRHLMRTRWAAAVDNVGGATLDYLLRTVKPYGNVALCGLVGGSTFRGTVMPFLLRGVNLLGIDSGHVPIVERQALWDRLATDLRPRHLHDIARRIALADLPDVIASMLGGEVHGRFVVAIEAERGHEDLR